MKLICIDQSGNITQHDDSEYVGKAFPVNTRVYRFSEFEQICKDLGIETSREKSYRGFNNIDNLIRAAQVLDSHGERCSCEICQKDTR